MKETASLDGKLTDFLEMETRVYLGELDRLSEDLACRPQKSGELYGAFKAATDRLLSKGEDLLQDVDDRKVEKQVKKRFREKLTRWLHNGSLTERAFLRPRGYPGDYQTIDLFYDNAVTAQGMPAFWDRYLLDLGYVQAVRDRKDHMREVLTEYFKSHGGSDLRILNLGSGSCRELRELPPALLSGLKGLRIALIDQDRESLDFSRRKLGQIHPQAEFRFLQANVLDYARHPEEYGRTLGPQDLIYSIGLADYIPDEYLGGMLKTSFALLKPGGSIIIAHKNLGLHKSLASDWFCDWRFIPRTAEDLQDMAREYLKGCLFDLNTELIRDGHIFFMTIDRK